MSVRRKSICKETYKYSSCEQLEKESAAMAVTRLDASELGVSHTRQAATAVIQCRHILSTQVMCVNEHI